MQWREDTMRRLHLLITLAPLALAGCLNPLTVRIDATNAQITQTNSQMAQTNQMLMLANQHLEETRRAFTGLEAKLDQMNQSLGKMEGHLEGTNQKLGTMEKGFSKLLGGKPQE